MSTDTDHIQLVWDRECAGTAQAQSGCSITVGPASEWTPEQLLLAAAESSVMSVFLKLAEAGALTVLGYVSTVGTTLDPDQPEHPGIIVRPCIVVGSEEDRESARRLIDRTAQASPVARALRDTLRIDAEIIVVAPVSDGA